MSTSLSTKSLLLGLFPSDFFSDRPERVEQREHLANMIRFLHVLLIGTLVTVPFLDLYAGNEPLLTVIFLLFGILMLHWVVNTDACALTYAEALLRGRHPQETFFGQLFRPIFRVDSAQIWMVTVALFAFVSHRLWSRYRFRHLRRCVSVMLPERWALV